MKQKIMLGCPGVSDVLEMELESGQIDGFTRDIGASKLEVKTLPVPLYLLKDKEAMEKVKGIIQKK